MSDKNTSTKPVGTSPRKLAAATPTPPGTNHPAPDLATKLFLVQTLSELLLSGQYEIEFPDELIVGKFANRVARLEARVAELEKAAGKAPPVDRADTAKLAGKWGK